MSKELKAIAIFAGMIALPIVADNLISRKPDIRLFGGLEWAWALVPIVIFCAVAIPIGFSRYWKFKEDIEQIESWLKIAERELLKLLGDNWDQAGRHTKVKERAEWNRMAQTPSMVVQAPSITQTPSVPEMPPILQIPPVNQTQNITQTFNEGYRSVAHEAFELNKDDMKNRGAAMGKASMTAVLLRELYQGSTGRARAKIKLELTGEKPPFVAPGVAELIGYEHVLDGEKWKGQLKEKAPFDWIKLTLAVRHGQFPKELLLIEDKAKSQIPIRGWEVIWKLTQQLPPHGWQHPEPAKPASMWRLWIEWMTTFE